jgi:hypothetical protein
MKSLSLKAGALGLSTVLALAATGIALTAAPASAIATPIPCQTAKTACVGGKVDTFDVTAARFRGITAIWTNQSSWKATTSASWLVATASGAGTTNDSGTPLNFQALPNTTGVARSGYIQVTAGSAIPHRFYVNQAGTGDPNTPCITAVNSCVGGKAVNYSGSQDGFKITEQIWTNEASWTASSTANWVVLTSAFGGTWESTTGPGTLAEVGATLYATALVNSTGYNRTATVVVKAGKATAYEFTIYQPGPLGEQLSISVNPASRNQDANYIKTDAQVTLTPAGAVWTAQSLDPWLVITSGIGYSGGSFHYDILDNASTSPRVGTIRVYAGNATPYEFKVYQEGTTGTIPDPQTPSFLVLDQNEVTIPAAAPLGMYVIGATTALTFIPTTTTTPDWIIPSNYFAGRSAVFQVLANRTGKARTGIIIYTYEGEKVTLTVTQKG